MERTDSKPAPSVLLIIDDDAARAQEVASALRRAFAKASVKVVRWSDRANQPRDSMVDLAIIAPQADTTGPGARRALPEVLSELKHVPTIVLASAGDPQSAVNAVLDGASDAIIMQERYLDLLPVRVSRTLARSEGVAGTNRRRADRGSALLRVREENRKLRSRISSLRVAAMVDHLTGLANRRALDLRLTEAWDAAVLASGELSCLAIDIDRFKRVNDTMGHAAGDLVLCVLARVLTEQFRQDDSVARPGGDEFVVLLPSADADQAVSVARRVQAAYQHAIVQALGGELDKTSPNQSVRRRPAVAAAARAAPPGPTLSIGVASRTRNRPTCADDLLAHADAALYAAKTSGRNRIVLATGIGAPSRRLASAG
ncbi:MAG: GGDEF domain-containing protein [Phycisphaerales bacterium]